MDNINKNVLAALTDNPTHLFADFLRFLESTQPTTVTSSSSPNGKFNRLLHFNMCVHIFEDYNINFLLNYFQPLHSLQVPSISAISGMFTNFYF
ncbi:uncharacterized protein LOC136080780 isoform X5 [Hydra vulgaris]|uniref:Uncharacterized protein LOC136080780 isoform X5 n=1 Tax=Hydra vulgaris TaxID=6087 RepID=A0ABM4BXK5_HYDVU